MQVHTQACDIRLGLYNFLQVPEIRDKNSLPTLANWSW